MKLKVFIFFIFLASVFLTSEKFVNEENSVKFYFTIISVQILLLIILIKKNLVKTEIKKLYNYGLIKSFYIVGVLQAVYGIFQYTEIIPSKNSNFKIIGTFDNPAGFVAVLSLLYPIGLYWCIKSKRLEQRLIFFSLGIILFSIILSGSRTGILAIICSTIVTLILEYQLISKIKSIKQTALIILSIIFLIFFLSFILFKLKEDSASGRLLIWRVSIEMIKNKPFLGYGINGFKANYMDFQSYYFKSHPDSKYIYLADNVVHPFNEFIKIQINWGILGLLLFILFLTLIFIKVLKTKEPFKIILLGVLVSFLILSCFSYPLYYAPVCFLLIYLSLILFIENLQEKTVPLISRIILFSVLISGIIFFYFKMDKEMQWKEIAKKSLEGKTLQMLPLYEKFYPYLKNNGLFLYNYGAELNVAGHYSKSIEILEKCMKKFNDYDLQMILADNFYHTGKTQKAIETYKHAGNMIPNRFLPLYYQLEIFEKENNTDEAKKIAKEILKKKVKVKSQTIDFIIEKAKNYLNENKN